MDGSNDTDAASSNCGNSERYEEKCATKNSFKTFWFQSKALISTEQKSECPMCNTVNCFLRQFAQYSTISLNRTWRASKICSIYLSEAMWMHRVVNGECFSLTGIKTCGKPSVFPFPTNQSHVASDDAQRRERSACKQRMLFTSMATGYATIPCHLQHTLHSLYYSAPFHPSNTPTQCDWCKVGERKRGSRHHRRTLPIAAESSKVS